MISNVLLTALTPLKIKNEIDCWENQPFTTVWPENNIQKKTGDITRTIKKKKQKRVRTAFSTEQLRALEKAYAHHRYINSEKRAELSNSLNIGDKCIKIWFQNRRMKEKKESSESSCDSSSESVSTETISVPASPPLQTFDQRPYDYINYSTYNNSEHTTYQLPTYCNTNQTPPNYGGLHTPSFGTYFYNDNNMYPTQYYPFEVNYSYGEANGINQNVGEINNCWSNNYPYYSTI